MAKIAKNEVVAGKRQIDVEIWKSGALVPANAGVDFMAEGLVFVPNAASLPNYKLATGTLVQKRRFLEVDDDVVESADTGADTLTLTAHKYQTGDGPLFADEAIGGVSSPPSPGFYAIKVDDNTIAVAETIADAFNDVRRALTGTETGATISDNAAITTRAIPSIFTYTFTQAETNVDLDELSVLIDGEGYHRVENGGGYATAELDLGAADMWSVVSSEGLTNQEKLNLAARFATAPFDKTDNDYQWRKIDDSGDSHSFTVTPAGRSNVDITDPD